MKKAPASHSETQDLIERAAQRIEEGHPDKALELLSGIHDVADIAALRGFACLELGWAERARSEYETAVSLAPDASEFHGGLAYAHLHCLDLDSAAHSASRALDLDPTLGDAHECTALVHEHRGDFAAADAAFARATECDPEHYPPPIRMEQVEFEEIVANAIEALPADLQLCLQHLPVIVENVPSADDIAESDPPLPPTILGMFTGPSLAERSVFDTGDTPPPRILLYKRNLERYAKDRTDLQNQIIITFQHEFGHLLGHDEDGVHDMGLT